MKLRNYQQRSIDELFAWFSNGGIGNPLMVLPTAAGKSVILAAMIKLIFQQWPSQRILMLTHVKELIEQNYSKLRAVWPEADAGIYSAGIGRKDTENAIIYAGIQSIHKKALHIGRFDLIFIDEAHLVPNKQMGTYRKFIADCQRINPQLRVIGLTATPFRLGTGYLYTGEDAIFSCAATEVTVNELLDLGYLSPLVSKHTGISANLNGLKKRGGEYIDKELEAAFDEVLYAALDDVISKGQYRKKWLIFNSSVAHAEKSCDYLHDHGISVAIISGATQKAEREEIIADYKAGKYQALCNCQVLTTGFDAPEIDLIAMLRATESTALYIQICGRGMRIAEGKKDCLVLDYGKNIERHGCVDDPIIKIPKDKRDKQEAPVKICEVCDAYCHATATRCHECGTLFPVPKPRIEEISSEAEILTSQRVRQSVDVGSIELEPYKARNKPTPTLLVKYIAKGMLKQELAKEWICFEHSGYARNKAIAWWYEMGGNTPAPLSIDEAIDRKNEINSPCSIEVKKNGNYYQVAARIFKKEAA